MSSGVGKYDITVSGGSAENYRFVYDNTGTFEVTSAIGGSLVVTGPVSTVAVGQKFLLQAFYGNSKVEVKWSIEPADSGVAEITQDGFVTALKEGTVMIRATAGEITAWRRRHLN